MSHIDVSSLWSDPGQQHFCNLLLWLCLGELQHRCENSKCSPGLCIFSELREDLRSLVVLPLMFRERMQSALGAEEVCWAFEVTEESFANGRKGGARLV